MSRLSTFLDAMRPLLEEQGACGAWLFGSQARGTADAESDIDLIVVQPSDEPSPTRPMSYMPAILKAGGAVDILVYTPEELEAMKEQERPFLITALVEAKQVYVGTPWAETIERELEALRGGTKLLGPLPPAKARAEAERWLEQAEYDLGFARYALEGRHYNQVCFISQQAAEKAVKAIVYGSGARRVRGHSIVELIDHFAEAVPELKELLDQGEALDVHYISSRYPNGLAGGVPFTTYCRPMAEAALEAAGKIVVAARVRVDAGRDG